MSLMQRIIGVAVALLMPMAWAEPVKYLRVEDAALAQAKKWQRTGDAKPILSDDGKVLYPFGQYMPTLTCSPLRACDIELEPGEEVVSKPMAGDTARWMIARMESGPADNTTIHVVAKPRAEALATNLIIPTDRRVYHIELKSVSTSKGYVHRVGFYYPEDMVAQWGRDTTKLKKLEAARDELVVSDLPSIALDQVDFDYKIDGTANFRPVRVFNDGKKTYIQMPSGVAYGEMPVLVVLDEKDNPMLVNYRNKHGYFIVDKVVQKAMLVLGSDDTMVKVTITQVKKSESLSAAGDRLLLQ